MDADILDGSWVNFSRFTWALSGARNRRAQWHCSTRSKYVQHHILLAGPNRPTIGDTQEEKLALPIRSSRGDSKEDCSECSKPVQSAWIRQCLDQPNHGRRRSYARCVLHLFCKQKRSVRGGLGMFLHRPRLE